MDFRIFLFLLFTWFIAINSVTIYLVLKVTRPIAKQKKRNRLVKEETEYGN